LDLGGLVGRDEEMFFSNYPDEIVFEPTATSTLFVSLRLR
jgi:hypothetical protein